jgi:hypothetical protein
MPILRFKLGRWRITLSFAPVTKVIGVNSKLPDGNHILMWDFDDKSIFEIILGLQIVQYLFNLPKIYVLNTGKPRHFIAYCFYKVPWELCKAIVAITPFVCPNFYKYGVYRDKFTLRVSPKNGRKPKLVAILNSKEPETATIKELRSWVKYETLEDGLEMKVLEIGRIFD